MSGGGMGGGQPWGGNWGGGQRYGQQNYGGYQSQNPWGNQQGFQQGYQNPWSQGGDAFGGMRSRNVMSDYQRTPPDMPQVTNAYNDGSKVGMMQDYNPFGSSQQPGAPSMPMPTGSTSQGGWTGANQDALGDLQRLQQSYGGSQSTQPAPYAPPGDMQQPDTSGMYTPYKPTGNLEQPQTPPQSSPNMESSPMPSQQAGGPQNPNMTASLPNWGYATRPLLYGSTAATMGGPNYTAPGTTPGFQSGMGFNPTSGQWEWDAMDRFRQGNPWASGMNSNDLTNALRSITQPDYNNYPQAQQQNIQEALAYGHPSWMPQYQVPGR